MPGTRDSAKPEARGGRGVTLRVACGLAIAAGCGRINYDAIGGGVGGDGGPAGGDAMPIDPDLNVVFVTSSTVVPGELGGLAGADAECNDRAAAAGFAGPFIAYLSSSTEDAIDRLAGVRGWQRPDGLLVYDVYDASIEWHVPNVDELGNRLVDAPVLTASRENGRVHNNSVLPPCDTCADFTDPGAPEVVVTPTTSRVWSYGTQTCDQPAHLYCFGVGSTMPVDIPAPTGPFAFLSSAAWQPSGIADADALCQGEADAAGLPGTYRAMLPEQGGSLLDRFDVGGPPWVRPDGARIAASRRDFFEGRIDSRPLQHADGASPISVFLTIWTGYAAGEVGTDVATQTCGPTWDAPSGAQGGQSGAFLASPDLFGGGNVNGCNFDYNLLCLQE